MVSEQENVRSKWVKYLHDYNEGLGLVYERLVLNDYLEQLTDKYPLASVLEAPIFGMAGVSGINSVQLAKRGVNVTLVDDLSERLTEIRRIWSELGLSANFVHEPNLSHLPFPDKSFDLTWEWAALWYHSNAEDILRELARTSRKLVFIAMPNRVQVGYLLRKYFLERDFVKYVDENWADIRRIKRVLQNAGLRIIEEGVLDVPPWPDTVMPAAQVLKKFGLRPGRFEGNNWKWSTMDYYLGKQPNLRSTVDRYAFIEHAPLPWQLKAIWAHHRYILGQVS